MLEEGFIKFYSLSGIMPILKELIKKINETISASERLFNQEFTHLARVRDSGQKEGKISFSTTARAGGLCVGCGTNVVDYTITGIWEEDCAEGMVSVRWKCRKCNREFNFHGKKGHVIGQITDILSPLAA